MKTKLFSLIILASLRLSAEAQNVFPTNGNVGIGTTDPFWRLHVVDPSSNSRVLGGWLQPNLADGGSSLLFFGKSDAQNLCGTLGYFHNEADSTRSSLSLGLFGSSRTFNVFANGTVGIGTTGPGQLLALQKEVGDVAIAFRQASLGLSYTMGIDDADNQKFKIAFGGAFSAPLSTPLMTFDRSGQVGIGTITPHGKLDVNGDAYFRAGIDVNQPYQGQREPGAKI